MNSDSDRICDGQEWEDKQRKRGCWWTSDGDGNMKSGGADTRSEMCRRGKEFFPPAFV